MGLGSGQGSRERRKHGVSFEVALEVFVDPLSVTLHDVKHSDSEDRWCTIGQTTECVVIVVFYTYDDIADRGRLISARKASLRERREYEAGTFTIREPSMSDDYDLPDEVDFSKGVRGALYKEGDTFTFPVMLDADVMTYFFKQARKRRIGTTAVLNEVLRGHMRAAEADK
jgi:uncharacterized DUF497 family protein